MRRTIRGDNDAPCQSSEKHEMLADGFDIRVISCPLVNEIATCVATCIATRVAYERDAFARPHKSQSHQVTKSHSQEILARYRAPDKQGADMLKVRKAVFPVAGLGTRFLPATKASPKEMLPIVDKPLIQYAVEEAIAAGITEMIFVTGRGKRAIEDHFDKSYEIESELEARGKRELLDLVRNIKPSHVDCVYVRQAEPLGLGHAVLCAEKLIGDNPFAVILADDLLHGKEPVMKQLVDVFNRYHSSVLGVEEIDPSESGSYGVIDGREWDEHLFKIARVVEKPEPALAPSNLGVVGRYVLMPRIFQHLRTQK